MLSSLSHTFFYFPFQDWHHQGVHSVVIVRRKVKFLSFFSFFNSQVFELTFSQSLRNDQQRGGAMAGDTGSGRRGSKDLVRTTVTSELLPPHRKPMSLTVTSVTR